MPPRTALWYAVDLLLAFVGYVVVCFGPVGVVASVLLPPDPITQLFTVGVVALVSAPLAVWHVRTGRSLAPLGELFFTVVALQTLALVAAIPFVYLAGWLSVSVTLSPVVGVPFVLALYPLAYYLVYRDGWAEAKTRLAHRR